MSQLLEDIARPISDSEPAGEDITRLVASPENEEWIRIYGELRELTGRVATNCESIVAISQNILIEKSKDLRIAGHLCMGLLHQKGFSGLAEGLMAYHILLEQFWDKGLFPAREAARASNIKTLDKRLGADISAKTGDNEYFVPASPTDSKVIEEIRPTADAIAALLAEKVPARAVPMAELIRTMTARQRELGPIEKPKPEPEPEKEAEPEPPKPKPKSLLKRITSSSKEKEDAPPKQEQEVAVAAEITSEVEAIKSVIRAVDFLIKKDTKNAASYRLRRTALWYSLPLFNPAEIDKNAKPKTQYLPPIGKMELEQLLQSEDWEALITQCEEVFAQRFDSGNGGSFCLDIQRFLSTALKEIIKKADAEGDNRTKEAYMLINKVVLQETALFVERYPWICDLLYSDETPFADAQTKNWVEKTVKPVLGSGSAQTQGNATGDQVEGASQISEELEQALDLLSRQKWSDALDLMQKGIDTEPTRRGRFLRRMNLAILCLNAGQSNMARPILEQLDEEIERFSLDKWEPGICVSVWNYLRHCYQTLLEQTSKQADENPYEEKADLLFEKICRVDIRVALTDNK